MSLNVRVLLSELQMVYVNTKNFQQSNVIPVDIGELIARGLNRKR